MNKWLDSTIKNYRHYFGGCGKPVVWDVGSRDGHDGVELAKRIYTGNKQWFWDNAEIVCMEPNPEQALVIMKNYPEVKILEVAASDKVGTAPFVVYEGDEGAVGSSSLNLDWKEGDHSSHQIYVETNRLENLLGAGEIDIMKIDVEGHSVEALDGLGDKLRQIRVIHVETEKWTNSNVKVKAFMMAKGFTLVDEQEQYGGMPDLVFVRY